MSEDRLEYDRATIVRVLRDLEQLVVSLDRLGSASALMSETEAATACSAFVTEWDVFRKLAHARAALGASFSRELGPDDMDELEREMGGVTYWVAPAFVGERSRSGTPLVRSSVLEQIEAWYADQCDGDWEHNYGVHVETLDNPGWWVRVDLADTCLEGVPFERRERKAREDDWLTMFVEGGQFVGYGDPSKLGPILSTFLAWAHAHPDETAA